MNMKSSNKIILIISMIVLIVASVVILIQNKKTSEDRISLVEDSKSILMDAKESFQESKENSIQNMEFSGVFESFTESKISSETQGKIIEMKVELGSYVSKGQVLCKIDNTMLKLQKNSLDIQIEGMEKDVKRFEILSNSDAIQKVQLEKAEIGLRSLISQRAILEEQIEKSIIKAPFSGVITHIFNDLGTFANPSMPIMQLSEVSKLKFVINVPESDLNLFKLDSKVTLDVESLPDLKIEGTVIYAGSKSNMGNNFPIHFQVNNVDGNIIKPGMYGRINLKESKL